jgi:hypothetical protein
MHEPGVPVADDDEADVNVQADDVQSVAKLDQPAFQLLG